MSDTINYKALYQDLIHRIHSLTESYEADMINIVQLANRGDFTHAIFENYLKKYKDAHDSAILLREILNSHYKKYNRNTRKKPFIVIPVDSKEQGKEIAEDLFGGMLWDSEDSFVLKSYPIDSDNPVEIYHGARK